MNFAALLDPASAAIVVGGTAFATFLRCGTTSCAHAIRALGRLFGEPFDAPGTKAELAGQLREIHKEGLLRVTPRHFADREFDEANDALIGRRSIAALHAAHERHQALRAAASARASATLAQAAELAPVFGLAGTLISLSQMPTEGIARGAYAGAIGMAVLTTLYGLLLANLVLAPLSRVIDRQAAAEERERQKIIDWLADQVAREINPRRPGHLDAAA